MQPFLNSIRSLLYQFLKGVGWSSVLMSLAGCLCVTVTLQLARGRRFARSLVTYCVVLSLYATFVMAVTLLGRSPGMIDDVTQRPFTMEYSNETEHDIDIVYNAMLFAPFGFLLTMGFGTLPSLAIVVLATCTIEIVQMGTGMGLFELSDIFGNVVGGAVGICAFHLGQRILNHLSRS